MDIAQIRLEEVQQQGKKALSTLMGASPEEEVVMLMDEGEPLAMVLNMDTYGRLLYGQREEEEDKIWLAFAESAWEDVDSREEI